MRRQKHQRLEDAALLALELAGMQPFPGASGGCSPAHTSTSQHTGPEDLPWQSQQTRAPPLTQCLSDRGDSAGTRVVGAFGSLFCFHPR